MITLDMYKNLLDYRDGAPLGYTRRQVSKSVINNSFTNDPNYRKVRVLTTQGWMLTDAKFSQHQTQSISGDIVDWWLEFRPDEYHTIGAYVIIGGDDNSEPSTYEDEYEYFKDENSATKNDSNMWMIVNKNSKDYMTRYNIIRCNWNFKWIYNAKLCECIGAIRTANSYTSGVWQSDRSVQLDNLTSAWLPDTNTIYGDALSDLAIEDTRTITYGTRFMFTHNVIYPKVYSVSKVLDLAPQGLIKLSIKQDEYDERRDDLKLMVCDYYSDTGNTNPNPPEEHVDNENKIVQYTLNENYQLDNPTEITNPLSLNVGEMYYFGLLTTPTNIVHWDIALVDGYEDDKHSKDYYERLISIETIDDTTVSVKPGKAGSLIGKMFILKVYDDEGTSYSSVTFTVTKEE